MTGQIVSVVWHYCQRFSLRCWGKVFQWLPKDWHKKVSDFYKICTCCMMYILQQYFLIGTFNDKADYTLLRQVQKWRNRVYFTMTGTYNDETEYTLLWQVHTMTKQSILYYDRYTMTKQSILSHTMSVTNACYALRMYICSSAAILW